MGYLGAARKHGIPLRKQVSKRGEMKQPVTQFSVGPHLRREWKRDKVQTVAVL